WVAGPGLGASRKRSGSYGRNLWDRGGAHRDGMQRLVLPAKLWRLGGARPLNHPQRRLGALATLAKQWPAFLRAIGRKNPKNAHDFLLALHHPFWSFHYTLTSEPTGTEMAVIGDSRIADILANVLVPWFL